MSVFRNYLGSVDISLGWPKTSPFDTAIAYSGCVLRPISYAECLIGVSKLCPEPDEGRAKSANVNRT